MSDIKKNISRNMKCVCARTCVHTRGRGRIESEQNFVYLGFSCFMWKQISDSWLSPGPLISHIPECHSEKEKRKPNTLDLARIKRKNGMSLLRLMTVWLNFKFIWQTKEWTMSNDKSSCNLVYVLDVIVGTYKYHDL